MPSSFTPRQDEWNHLRRQTGAVRQSAGSYGPFLLCLSQHHCQHLVANAGHRRPACFLRGLRRVVEIGVGEEVRRIQ